MSINLPTNYELEIIIIGASETILSDCLILLQNDTDSTILYHAEFIEREKKYVFTEIATGGYQLIVYRKGYNEESRSIVISESKTFVELQLIPKSINQIRIGTELVDFVPYPELVGIFSNLNSYEDLLELGTFLKLPEFTDSKKNHKILDAKSKKWLEYQELILPRVIFASIGGIEAYSDDNDILLENLRNHHLISSAGPIFELKNSKPTILTERILVIFSRQVYLDEIKLILNKYGCIYIEPIEGLPNTHIVSANKNIGLGILDLLEQLHSEEKISCVIPEMSHSIERAAPKITPNDYLWKYTWSGQLARVDEAWKVLQTINTNKTFGDPNLIITIIDTGIKSIMGKPIHKEFDGSVSDTTEATISVDYLASSIQSVIVIDKPSVFSAGDSISLNYSSFSLDKKKVHAAIDINSGQNQQLTIDPLFFKYSKNTGVFDHNVIQKAHLTELVNETKSVLTVSNIIGIGFKIGQVISVGNHGDPNAEQVRILKVDGNTIITTPLLNNHFTNEKIATGRKVLRLQDFRAGNLSQNNDQVINHHGISVAGISASLSNNKIASLDNGAFGSVGVAANCQVISAYDGDGSNQLGPDNYQLLFWAAAIHSFKTIVPWLDIESSIINWSAVIQRHDSVHIDGNPSKMVIEITLRKSRSRRGVLLFIASGNDSQPQSDNFWASHPGVFSCSSSRSILQAEYKASNPYAGDIAFKELRSPFSNYSNANGLSEVSFCAPSGNGLINNHHHALYRNIIAPDIIGQGNVVGQPDKDRKLKEDVIGSYENSGIVFEYGAWVESEYIKVSDVTPYVGDNGKWVFVGKFRENQSPEWVKLRNIDAVDVVNNRLYLDPVNSFSGNHYPYNGVGLPSLPNVFQLRNPPISGGATIQIKNPTITNELEYIQEKMVLEINGGTQYVAVTSILSTIPLPVDGTDTYIEITVDPPLINGFLDGQSVIVPTKNSLPLILRSQIMKLDDAIGINADDWITIMSDTPPDSNFFSFEALNVQSVNIGVIPHEINCTQPVFDFKITENPRVYVGSNDYTNDFSGTSASAPLCAGIGALVLSANPYLTWTEVRELFQNTCLKIDVGTIGFPLGSNAGVGKWFDKNGDPVVEHLGTNKGKLITSIGDSSSFLVIPVGGVKRFSTIIEVVNGTGFTKGMAIQIGDETVATPQLDHSVIIDIDSSGKKFTIEPLTHDYLGITGTIPVKAGRSPYKSDWYGFGRIDAYEAVKAAKEYSHDYRDLMIRNYLISQINGAGATTGYIEDNGKDVTDIGITPILSPDIWLRNSNDSIPTLDRYEFGPHENPKSGIDNPIFFGLGTNDLRVKGIYTASTNSSIEIEITSVGESDEFTWKQEGNQTNGPFSISGGYEDYLLEYTDLENLRIAIKFDNDVGHTVGDKWVINLTGGQDRWIYTRVFNRGNTYDGLEAKVRFYVGVSDGEPLGGTTPELGLKTPFYFPNGWQDDFDINYLTNSDISGIFLLKEGSSPAGEERNITGITKHFGSKIVKMKWDSFAIPITNTSQKLFLISEVIPHDGVIKNSMGNVLPGCSVEDNNNISFRQIHFAGFEFIHQGMNTILPTNITVDEFGNLESTAFEIRVKSWIGTILTEKILIQFIKTKSNGIKEIVVFNYNENEWEFNDTSQTWVVVNSPFLSNTIDLVNGEQTEISFTGIFSVSKEDATFTIKAMIGGSSVFAEDSIDINIIEEASDPTGLIPSPGQPPLYPQSYTFTDFADLNTQPSNLAFGPSTGSETNKFRVTSSFTASSDVNAYAMVNGFVMIQPGATADKVNLILRPFTQPIPGFSKVKYIIYRGLRMDEFIDTNDDTKVVAENLAENSEWITQLYSTHHNLNPSGEFLSKALGYDPSNQLISDLIDDYFFSTNSDFQLPFIARGAQLGKFFANGGSSDFGIDIILEDRKFIPNLDYARKAFHEIDITGLPTGTDAEKFTKRVKQDEILNFMDLAAFYGIHHTEEGKVRRRNGSNNTEPIPLTDLYSDVIDKFATRNAVYVDIRNELGDSLNFFTNYNDGSGNQIQLGTESGTLALMAYQTHGWPVLIKDNASAPFDTDNDFNEIFLQLRVDDNLSPMLFVKHGDLSTTAVKNKFVEGDNLISGANPWTNEIGLTYPNTGTSGAKLNVSWFLKLNYSRKLDSNTVYPNTVVQTNYYADNLFGSIDAVQPWDSSENTQWNMLQADQYVDGSESGFGQVSEKGIAVDQAQSTDRVILYTNLTDNFASSQDFTPNSGQTSGTNQQESFLTEPMLFKGYNLDFNIINSSPNVTTLRFKPNPDNPISEQNTQILGLTKNQLDSLKSLNGYDNRYPRTVVFDKLGDFTDTNGKPYSKFKLGVNGLDNNGHYLKQFPNTDLEVYSLDELFFTSTDFANLEPTPTEYTRDTEENNGAKLKHPAKTLIIESVDTGAKKIKVKGKDAMQLTENEKVTVSGSAGNNGTYTVKFIVSQGTENTIIEVKESIPSSASPFGQLTYSVLAWEDYFILLDQSTSITNPADKMETIVANFTSTVNAVPNNETAPGLLETAVNTYASMILNRARAFVNENYDTSNANPDDRILYWARLKMLVILKSHPYLLGSIFDRNLLVSKFEDLSRGYSTATFSGVSPTTKKILITGFDPYNIMFNQANSNIKNGNTSGVSTLYLHGKGEIDLGVDAVIHTVIFPTRYRDFDDGVIDRFFNQFMDVNKVDMIITLSQGRVKRYDVERWASKFRSVTMPDNEGITNKKHKFYVPDGNLLNICSDIDSLTEFFKTKLPVSHLVSSIASENELKQGDVIFNQMFKSIADESPESPPNSGNIPNSKNPDIDNYKALSGSGGSFLSNEVFYRVSLLKQHYGLFENIKSGHIHIPVLQNAKDLDDLNKNNTKELIIDLKKLVIRAINSLL